MAYPRAFVNCVMSGAVDGLVTTEVCVVKCYASCKVCGKDSSSMNVVHRCGFAPGYVLLFTMHNTYCDQEWTNKRRTLTPRSDPFFISPGNPLFRGTMVRQKTLQHQYNSVKHRCLPGPAKIVVDESKPFVYF